MVNKTFYCGLALDQMPSTQPIRFGCGTSELMLSLCKREGRIRAIADQRIEEQRQIDRANRERRQDNLIHLVTQAVANNDLSRVPQYLREMDDAHFLRLGQQQFTASEDIRDLLADMLYQEEVRRGL